MPLHDYECPNEHIYEANHPKNKAKCPECGKVGEIVWLSPSSPHRQLQRPIVMWRYSDGSLGVAGGADSKTPKGAERVEIRSIGEYRRHVKELNDQHRSKEVQKDERYFKVKERLEAERRATLAHMMGQETDPYARDIYREALERGKSERMPSSFSEYYSVAMEMDRSNYE